MALVSHPVILLAALVTFGGWSSWRLVDDARTRVVEAGFWFEEVRFRYGGPGEPLGGADLARIERTARAEVERAFEGLRIRVSDRRSARYKVRVVQDVRDARLARPVHVAGQSRGMAGFGGSGVVSFDFLASAALVYAPPGLDRTGLVEAIGRGIGRAAVHEFTHQLLPRAPIHASRDRASYEFYSAARVEQYVGEMRWDIARPLLLARFAP